MANPPIDAPEPDHTCRECGRTDAKQTDTEKRPDDVILRRYRCRNPVCKHSWKIVTEEKKTRTG